LNSVVDFVSAAQPGEALRRSMRREAACGMESDFIIQDVP
jgi:hypothetical protein